MKLARSLTLLAAFIAALPAATAAETVRAGQVGHAFYRIVVPDLWNGDLVIWNHGFTAAPPGPVSDLGPLAALQLSQGYAVAASSYQQSGWAIFKTDEDLEALYQVFVEHFGAPQKVFVTGGSLGGLVTASGIERAAIGNVAGALSFCGVTGGSRNWDGILDARLVYDALCSSVPGAFIPGGAEGLPGGSTLTPDQLGLAVHACFGLLAPPALRTPAQQSRLAAFTAVTKVPESFVSTIMGYATFVLSDLVHDPEKLKGRIGTGNETVVYSDPAIDAAIARVSPHPGAASRLAGNYTPIGAVGATKIVALHTDKDGLAVVENGSEYAAVVPAANLATAVAVEAVPSHCGFTPAEGVAAWQSLRGWVAGLPKPTPASIQGLCTVLAPAFGGPCRIDPTFVIPDMDTRIPPR